MAEEDIQLLPTNQENLVSNDPESFGFDISAGGRWIYPENFPRREYQFSIVKTALFNNTLVCLPTGLGKTFIAAVVMYNFWRWYPRGKVVFLAPTKPLVAQQINACHEIMGIPSEETIELTGAINQNKRRQAWIEKRVIFATPQTFQKDLQNDCAPCELIKCIVIDEAHKALGKHSYCEIVRMVNAKNKFFRVLALSATPGSKIDHVREVIQNLLISELELRDDSSPDITPFTNDRSMEKIMVPLSKELKEYKERYIQIMDPHVRVLMKNHILQGNTANISKGRIFVIMKQYDSKPQKSANHGIIMKTLNVLLTMYHAYELLIKNGLRAFCQFYANHSDKYWINQELELKLMIENMKQYLGDFPNVQPLPDGTIPDVPENLVFGHDKFEKLQSLLVEHFQSFAVQNKSTRVIVFVEFRDIVNEVYVLLLQKRPLIRPQIFVGQAGLKQKQQLAALDDFRNNRVNVLISTSVGEEGLDVGEVDLIVCFDISSSTPTRLVQRMGRTGRKRNGRVVILLTEGKELQNLNQAMSKKDSLNNKVLQSSNICSSLYQSSPRMVPAELNPECFSLFIKALPKTPKTKGGRKPRATTKPPAEKKTRKKKKDADIQDDFFYVPEPSNSKNVQPTPKPSGPAQSSMMKFLTDNRQQKKPVTVSNYDTDSGIYDEFQVPIDKNNPYSSIKPQDVKLITSDNIATEFLTLCTIKKSNREITDYEDFIVDTNWIPKNSPVGDILRDFRVPSLDTLDCIKNLSLLEKSVDFDQMSYRSDDSLYDIPQEKREHVGNNTTNNFNNFSVKESKYADQQFNVYSLEGIEKDIDKDYDFSGDFGGPPEEPQCTKPSSIDFMDDFSFNSNNFEINKLEKVVKNNDNTNEILKSLPEEFFNSKEEVFTKPANIEVDFENLLDEEPSNSKEEIFEKPANVEVDFENLLDEYTESENSQTHVSIENKVNEGNIFDGLLSQDSEEDIFGSSQEEQNLTVIPNPQLEKTLTESPKISPRLSFKRSASRSPPLEAKVKKQKISELDDVDSDSELIFGTPPKPANSTFLSLHEISKAAPEINYPDSDVDIFEDLEFETQCTFTNFGNKIASNKMGNTENEKSIVEEEPTSKLISDQKVNIDTVYNKESSPKLNNNQSTGNKQIFLDKENNISSNFNKMSEPSFSEAEITIRNEKSNSNEYVLEEKNEIESCKNKKNASLHPLNYNSSFKNNKTTDLLEMDGIDFEDWNDDFSSIVVEKNKIEKERRSSFFETKRKNTSQNKLRSQPSQSSSTGWITVDKSLIKNQKKPLALKNLKPPKPSSFSRKLDISQKLNVETVKKSNLQNSLSTAEWLDDDDQEFQIFREPRTSLFKNKNPQDCIVKDKDGFIVPQIKRAAEERKTTEVTIPILSNICSNKENKLPRWRDSSRHKDNSISPRFRKYHSEDNLFTEEKKVKKKSKVRKRIANDFIEDEAEVSSDCDTSEGSSGEDLDLGNFVSYTQDIPDEIDTHAKYLQDLNKSPIRAGGFMFREVQNQVPRHEIFSQPMSPMNETYLHDSFCVKEDEPENSSGSYSSDGILETIESHLENRRKKLRNKKRSKFKSLKDKRANKIKKACSSSSSNDSSEDETEALRKQVLEESMMLKESKES